MGYLRGYPYRGGRHGTVRWGDRSIHRCQRPLQSGYRRRCGRISRYYLVRHAVTVREIEKADKNTKGKIMNYKFNELTKSMAKAVTRRAALKKFGVGLALGSAMLCLTTPLRAGEQVPFNGNFNPVILLATPIDDAHVHLDLHVTARATHMGNAQGAASITLNVTDFTYVGHTIWVASNGDSVALTFEGQF